jgi:serine/threonine protein kinase
VDVAISGAMSALTTTSTSLNLVHTVKLGQQLAQQQEVALKQAHAEDVLQLQQDLSQLVGGQQALQQQLEEANSEQRQQWQEATALLCRLAAELGSIRKGVEQLQDGMERVEVGVESLSSDMQAVMAGVQELMALVKSSSGSAAAAGGAAGQDGPARDQRPVSSQLVLDREQVEWHAADKLDSGGFGSVYAGTYHGAPVAVKQLDMAGLDTEGKHQVCIKGRGKGPADRLAGLDIRRPFHMWQALALACAHGGCAKEVPAVSRQPHPAPQKYTNHVKHNAHHRSTWCASLAPPAHCCNSRSHSWMLLSPPPHPFQVFLEAAVLSRLHHPCIVQFFGVVVEQVLPSAMSKKPQPRLSLVMERCDTNLAVLLHEHEPLRLPKALELASAIASALTYLHHTSKVKVVHGDLKPANVLLTENGRVKLTDFGLSQTIAINTSTLMHRGVVVAGGSPATSGGTLLWTAPEVIEAWATGNDHPAAPALDIYALGIILYQLLTGRAPYKQNTHPEALKVAVRSGKRPQWGDWQQEREGQAAAEVLVALQQLAEDCWAQEPGKRPTAQQVQKCLKLLQDQLG